MRILAKPTLIAFYAQATCADSKAPLLSWYGHVLRAPWSGPAALKSDFATAGILKEGGAILAVINTGSSHRSTIHMASCTSNLSARTGNMTPSTHSLFKAR